jgi:hypothetical protein
MRRYAEDTSVATDKSIAEIRSSLRHYGATNMMHVEGETQAAIVFDMKDRVMFRVAMPDPKSKEFRLTTDPPLVPPGSQGGKVASTAENPKRNLG